MNLKVLWIDDQEFLAMETYAETKGIDITHVYSWQEAVQYLDNWHFDDWTAVIFDCYCSMTPGGPEDQKFLRKAFGEFDKIKGANRILPWYVLSQGNRDSFDVIIDNQLSEERLIWDSDWEQIYYSKTGYYKNDQVDWKSLIDNICTMAPNLSNYKIRARFADVFNIISDTSIFEEKASNSLYQILKPLYFPHLAIDFKPSMYYNQLRQVIEYLFKSCRIFGYLPEECVVTAQGVNLQQSCAYLSGLNANNCGVRYGKIGESLFPHEITTTIWSLLSLANTQSHTAKLSEEDEKLINELFSRSGSEYELYSMALQLCSLIVWYRHFISTHTDVELYKSKVIHIDNVEKLIEDYPGIPMTVQKTNNIIHCGFCILLGRQAKEELVGNIVVLNSVEENTRSNKNLFTLVSNDWKIIK